MKMKLKNLKFKELFIQHVEKAVLAVAGVCLLLFLVSALQRETLPEERQPDRLVAQTNNAKTHVEKSTFDARLVRPEDAPVYAERVRRDPVVYDIYKTQVVLNPPIIDSKVKRDEPVYLTVVKPQLGVGFAPVALIDPTLQVDRPAFRRKNNGLGAMEAPGAEEQPRIIVDDRIQPGVKAPKDSKLVVKYWATITALVPVRNQKAEYQKTFEPAASYDPDQDVPKYLGYLVERAEVVSGDMQNLKWMPVKPDRKFMQDWNAEVTEPVMAEYVTNMFVMPLAPRVGSEWEPYVGHDPEIPFEPKRGAVGGGMGPGMPMRGEMFEGGMGGMGGRLPRGPGAGARVVDEEEGADFDRGGVRRRQQNIEEEGPEERRRRSEVVAILQERGGRDADLQEKSIKGVDHLLFRFCDFSVLPGKQYVYRVRLGLANPNKGVPVKFLKRPELADAKPRMTDWSEPSPIATIPYGDKILAGAVTPATVMKEPSAKVRIVQVKEDVGAEVPMEDDVLRGATANFPRKETKYVHPIDRTVTEYTGDFKTEAVVLDIRGGKPLLIKDKLITEPGELLVLSRTGQLIAMNEFDDEEIWQRHVVPEEKKPGVDGQDGMLRGPMNPLETERLPPKKGTGGKARPAQSEVDVLRPTGAPTQKKPRTKGAGR